MATTSIGDREMAGFTIRAFAPNIIEDIGCLKKKNNDYYPTNTVFIVVVYPRKLVTIQSRHETDRFLNNHCQECVRSYLSIHDCSSFLHEVMIGNHRTKTFLHEVMIGNHRNKTTDS
jgi:hypothetical protein